MKKLLIFLFAIPIINNFSFSQSHRIIESSLDHIKLEFNFEGSYTIIENVIDGTRYNTIDGEELYIRKSGEPWIPDYRVQIGIPFNSDVKISIQDISKVNYPGIFFLPVPDSLDQPFELLPFDQNIYNSNSFFPNSAAEVDGDFQMRYARIANISIAPYQFNPVSREVIQNKRLIVRIDFIQNSNQPVSLTKINDKMTDDILKSTVINYEIAREFTGKINTYSSSPTVIEDYWYNPQKDYYKFYLNKKGVYRITNEMLINAGIPEIKLRDMNFELFNEGVSIPLDIVDINNDEVFNAGDYFQFVGGPPSPTNAYTRMNIYNKTNVYWFSYEADSINSYETINGHPTGTSPLIVSTIHTLRFEEDLNYQRFGHAANDQRDYWNWLHVEARNRIPVREFSHWVEDSIAQYRHQSKSDVKLRVGMHGQTSLSCGTQNGHSALVRFNGQPVGVEQWNGQEPTLFQKTFYLGSNNNADTIRVLQRNLISVILDGNTCVNDTVGNDFVWINYIEFDYWRLNRTYPNYYFFKSPPNDFGVNRYFLSNWQRNNMKIYIPERGELISNPYFTGGADLSVVFNDTISVQTDYYCVADDYFNTPDSIVHHLNISDLRNMSNGADYIIITHPLFKNQAEQLAGYRSSNLAGYSNPRVEVVNILDIYTEFSYGLIDPFALQKFAKYTFENWQTPAPAFIVLFGDASYDMREIFATNRKNFVPSLPYHVKTFGQLPSDNLIVAVAGNDISPDISIGRLSCETIDEANVLVDKIINYPADDTKEWKENVILLASGLSYQDQIDFQFNYWSKVLETNYLIPNGIHATKVFNYPEPQDTAFFGSGPRMRQEINKGAALVNYYGHGGGAQWDLIFTKDDIPELTNQFKLPVVSSITCYTAHFDNAESFGEVFVKIPNKGAIGFWGSVGLTYWQTGRTMNQHLYDHLFNNRNYVIGSAILSAKATVGGGTYDVMTAQLAYLGDPAVEIAFPKTPDFAVKSSDITISPQNPLKDDTVTVSVKIRNWGVTFQGDSVTLEVFKNTTDSSNLIQEIKLSSFPYSTTANVEWIPLEAGLYNLIARINEKDAIEESDHSDNINSNSFSVFDFGQPNIIKPVNGYFTNDDKIDFVFSDIGFYFDRNFNYIIEINTVPDFNSGSITLKSPVLLPVDGVVKWNSGSLNNDEYFWRAVIFDVVDTNFSPVQSFSINNSAGSGYLAQNKQLQLFERINIDYSDELKSLILNTEVQPPHPEEKHLLDSIMISLPPDSTHPSTFTTDGTYFYFGHLPVWTTDSKIYKIGTGYNGTVAGENYGAIPNLDLYIYSNLMYYDGYLFTCTGSLDRLLKIDPQSGDTSTIQMMDSLLFTLDKSTQIGGVYLYSDGNYVYNLATGTSTYPNKFVLRTFDPSNNWSIIGEDIIFNGTTLQRVSSFIVLDDYLIVYENYNARALRRYRLSDGLFEEEWRYSSLQLKYYGIAYDRVNDLVYFSRFIPGINVIYSPGFFKYNGTFIEAQGQLTSQEIGPASKWHNLEFEIDNTNSQGIYKSYLFGKNPNGSEWDLLDSLNQSTYNLDGINVSDYNFIKLQYSFTDSSSGNSEPLKFNSLKVNYDYLPEISMIPKDLTFAPDSMLQGIDVNMNLKVNNLGYIPLDSLKIDFYLNEGDTVYFTRYISLEPDSFTIIQEPLETSKIIFQTNIKAVATSPIQEYYTYNNLIENQFFVARDSIKPIFSISFDGKEIIDGDIISSEPTIIITLEDNSPLPSTPSHFTLVHQNVPLNIETNPDIAFSYSHGEPLSKTEIVWTPVLDDGVHSLEILAKDSSGNFFDSTSHKSVFQVYSDADIRNVYNYPNPFADDTYFTFELRGTIVPEELRIKIYTIAGRLIREITIPPNQMQIGFNRYYWNGRDHEGDEIANGLYFYKVIANQEGETRTVTQKLAKVK